MVEAVGIEPAKLATAFSTLLHFRGGAVFADTTAKIKEQDMKTFRTLDLAVEFYNYTREIKLPRHLREQLDRAASSISLNLAEGNAKFSFKEKARIYQIAYGSFRESQTILRLAGYTPEQVEACSKHLGASLYRLIESTSKRA